MNDYHILEIVSVTWLFTQQGRNSDGGRLKLAPGRASKVRQKLGSSS